MRQLKIQRSLTNRESDSLNRYLKDISKEEMVTADHEVILAERIREGDLLAMEKLVKANLRFVVSVAKQYQGNGLTLSDLINEGNFGLVKAAYKFDEKKGFKFISYAVWWIRQSIISALANQTRIVRLPQNKLTDLYKLKAAKGKLQQQLEREPDNYEISVLMDVPEKVVQETLSSDKTKVSFDAPLGEDGCLLDVIPDHSVEDFDKDFMRDSLKSHISFLLSKLPEKERTILELSFGVNNNSTHTLEEIGEKFQVTKERIRQIREKALNKLKKTKKGVLAEYECG